MSLKYIFESITPENIKNIPLLATAMEIFIENLEKNSKISIDIKKIFDNDGDDVLSQTARDNLKKALLSIFLSGVYNTLSDAQINKEIIDRYNSIGMTGMPIENDINKILNEEFFITNKEFKQKIGTFGGMKYAYNFAKNLEGDNSDFPLDVQVVRPFHLIIDGSVTREIYRNVVERLSHPIGFTYHYSRIVIETIIDLFGLSEVYNVNNIEVRQLNGTIDVFTEDSTDINVQSDFVNNRGYTIQEYLDAVTNGDIVVHLNKTVYSITVDTIIDNFIQTVVFTDGTVLEQTTDPISVTYQDSFGNDIKIFDGHYSLYLNYSTTYVINYIDDVQFLDNQSIVENYDMTDLANLTDTSVESIFAVGGSYFTTTDSEYIVSDDGLDPASQWYFTGS